MDKTNAIVKFLLDCPQIKTNPLFFNFAEAQDNNKQIVTAENDKAVNRAYVDGSILKRYTFTIIDYRSVIYQAVVNVNNTEYPNENVEEFIDVKGIIDWITEQSELQNYPDFGEDCIIDDMRALSDNPNLNGIDTSVKPALAKYSVSIQIDYLDTSKAIWNNKNT